ncbi:MAG: hypothetical protein BIFFINMI_01490 [Phycisphaerae bacterium]|nr:hypothetical protein [Phycisphaerae bacterium]
MADKPSQNEPLCPQCRTPSPPGARQCVHCGTPLFPRPTGWRPGTWLAWSRWFLLHKVLHVDDTPHRIALGLAIGMFVTFTPTIPFQMVLTVALCWLLRANLVVGVPLVWITNPVTMGPIYYFNFRIGELLLGPGKSTAHESFRRLSRFRGGQGFWADLFAYAHHVWRLLLEVFWRCWLGSLIVSAVLAVATYFVGYWLVIRYRAWHRRRFPGSKFRLRLKLKFRPGRSESDRRGDTDAGQ